MAVAISLAPLTGLLFVKQVDNTRTYWQGKVQLSVYLCTAAIASAPCTKNGPATAAEKAQIRQQLTGLPQVASVTYLSQDQAFAQFKQEFAQDPAFVNLTNRGDIPDSFQVRLKNTQADAGIVAESINGAPGVDQVLYPSSILDKFYKLLDGARNAVVIIAIILIIAAILLVANTIRLSAFNRRRETSIMRLVGASNFYVQLPFLVEGMIAGIIGWLRPAAALLIAVKSLGLNALQGYFSFDVQLRSTDLIEVIVLTLILGILLTGMTRIPTLRRYLRV